MKGRCSEAQLPAPEHLLTPQPRELGSIITPRLKSGDEQCKVVAAAAAVRAGHVLFST